MLAPKLYSWFRNRFSNQNNYSFLISILGYSIDGRLKNAFKQFFIYKQIDKFKVLFNVLVALQIKFMIN